MILRLLKWWGGKRPYFNIVSEDDGSLYMGRWWLFGGSGFSLAEGTPRDDRSTAARGWKRGALDALIGLWVAARLHHIAREDRARDLHTHPCSFVSVVVRGWYIERLPLLQSQDPTLDRTHYREVLRRAGSIAFRRASDRHTIVEVSPGGAWTVFVMFQKSGSWGFWTREGFVNWRNYRVQP